MVKDLIIPSNSIKDRIHTIRGVQVILDSDLALLYEVKTKRLNEQVKRNIERFPEDFMFQLSQDELKLLRSQNVTLDSTGIRSQNATLKNRKGRHRKYLPYAFTEQGVAMLSGVLKSDTAIFKHPDHLVLWAPPACPQALSLHQGKL